MKGHQAFQPRTGRVRTIRQSEAHEYKARGWIVELDAPTHELPRPRSPRRSRHHTTRI